MSAAVKVAPHLQDAGQALVEIALEVAVPVGARAPRHEVPGQLAAGAQAGLDEHAVVELRAAREQRAVHVVPAVGLPARAARRRWRRSRPGRRRVAFTTRARCSPISSGRVLSGSTRSCPLCSTKLRTSVAGPVGRGRRARGRRARSRRDGTASRGPARASARSRRRCAAGRRGRRRARPGAAASGCSASDELGRRRRRRARRAAPRRA